MQKVLLLQLYLKTGERLRKKTPAAAIAAGVPFGKERREIEKRICVIKGAAHGFRFLS